VPRGKPARKPGRAPAPKRTGKRAIGPREETGAKTAEETEAGKTEEQKPASLLVEQPPKPTVVNDLFQAFFRAVTFSKNAKTDKRYVHLHMTVELSKDHLEVLPKLVARAQSRVSKEKGLAGERLKDVPRQSVGFYLTTDNNKDALANVIGCEFIQGKVDQVQKRGEGSARKILRLTFALKCAHNDDLCYFASHNFNNSFWISMHETQPDLLDLEEEDDDE